MADFANQVKELGGDEDDIAFLKDVDIDGSDYEQEFGKADVDLTQDVAKLWSSISGKGQKVKFNDDNAGEAATTVKGDDKLDQVLIKKDKKREKKAEKKAEKLEKVKAEAKAERKKSKAAEKKVEAVPKPKPQPSVPKQKPSRKIEQIQHPGHLLIEDNWESYLSTESTEHQIPVDLIPALKDKALELLRAENDIYQQQQESSREFSTSAEFLRSGTFSDQLGTLSILVTNSPLHSLKYMETLLQKCEIKNRESACRALEVTKDLLVNHVLPDRRLVWFRNQPALSLDSTERLIALAYEDWLKNYFFKILQIMEKLLSDTVENIRLRTLHCLFDFFRLKPEQETNLLRLGVNKFGDTSGKVASRVKKLLNDTLQVHPSMKAVVATAIAELLGRSSDYRTRYYAVDSLSEFILSQRDPQVPNQLVQIYLNLFERLLGEWDREKKDKPREEKPVANGKKARRPLRGKKGGIKQEQKTASQAEDEQNSRLVAKIFTGLNRAFPFSKLDPSVFAGYMDTLYRMSHSSNVSTFIEALGFIFQLTKVGSGSDTDRYYRTLYESLLDNRLFLSSKLAKYLVLVLKSIVNDRDQIRSLAFGKRLIQTAAHWPEIGAAAALCYITSRVNGLQKLLLGGKLENAYDPRQRDPKFAKADTTSLWELSLVSNHFHPTVALYANNILSTDPEPLDMPAVDQYTVASFLSKWSYKKPKEKENTRGGSIFQPLSGYTDLTLGVRTQDSKNGVPIPVQDWTARTADDVAPDEQFYLEYFTHKAKPKAKKEKKATTGDSDESADEDEVFEAIMKTNPDEMPSDEEGLGFSDMDDGDDDEELDEMAAAMEGDSDLGSDLGSDMDAFDDEEDSGEDDLVAGFANDVSDLDSEDEVEEKPTKASKKSKRKRDWAEYPTFMDADAFEETYSKKSKQ